MSGAPPVSARRALGQDGPFAAIPGFTPRAGQQVLAEAVADNLESDGVLVAEAATGIGKTWAYLVPALQSGKRVVISTATKHLQEQLFERDLPQVRRALGINVHAALLKGRANYLCRYRLEGARGKGDDSEALESLHHWAARSPTGDRSEVHWLGEDDATWPRVTSTSDNCLGRECPHFDNCFVYEARARAAEADLVVVNHDLLFASMALKQAGVEDFLPAADAYILDEAHKVPAIAAGHFGASFSSGQLHALADDTRAEAGKERGLWQSFQQACEALRAAARRLAAALNEQPPRGAWPIAAPCDDTALAMEEVDAALGALAAQLEAVQEASAGLANCLARARGLAGLFEELCQPEAGWVHWYQMHGNGFRLHRTPLQVTDPIARMTAGGSAWIFTSATLAVAGSFDHFTAQLGLRDAATLQVDSDFDYERNALLYLPRGLHEPGATGYDVERLVRACVPALTASRGRAFMLFTSYRALRNAVELLHDLLELPLFVQGTAPRTRLLAEFRESGNGVLLGTRSFWEGVDVRGGALSLVIIDRLPFESPRDPVFQVREKALREQDLNPFMHWSLPEAVLSLKQGAGRLIRHAEDRGVLMICDPRIVTKPYGRLFVNSLPPMPVTQNIADVRNFFA